MKQPGWGNRVCDAALAGLAGWAAGFLATTPFEFSLAKRYVSGHGSLLPHALAKGLLVWGSFTLFMTVVAWVLFVLPVALLVPQRWLVRWRWIFVPGAVIAAFFAMGWRLLLFTSDQYANFGDACSAFFTAPNTFAWIFALFLASAYVMLATRRLRSRSKL